MDRGEQVAADRFGFPDLESSGCIQPFEDALGPLGDLGRREELPAETMWFARVVQAVIRMMEDDHGSAPLSPPAVAHPGSRCVGFTPVTLSLTE